MYEVASNGVTLTLERAFNRANTVFDKCEVDAVLLKYVEGGKVILKTKFAKYPISATVA